MLACAHPVFKSVVIKTPLQSFPRNSLFLADVVTPEEQEQVFAANVHNLCKMASILLQECAEN